MQEELRVLKERQERRKQERAEEEREWQEKRKQEEERRRQEEEERKVSDLTWRTTVSSISFHQYYGRYFHKRSNEITVVPLQAKSEEAKARKNEEKLRRQQMMAGSFAGGAV